MIYKHKFNPPWEHGGTTYEEMEFDFGKLSGNDMLNLEEEILATTGRHLVPEFDKAYQYRFAAKAAGVSADTIAAMPATDFNRICNRSRSFLIGLDSFLQAKEKANPQEEDSESA